MQGDEVVRIDSLAAALAKLNVNIPIEDLIKVIHDEDGVKTTTEETQVPPPRAPPLADDVDVLLVVHTSSLAATLAKLDFKIPIEDFIKVLHDVDTAKRDKINAEFAAEVQRLTAVSKSKSAPLILLPVTMNIDHWMLPVFPVALQPSGIESTTAHHHHVDPERRRRLVELAKQAFPS